MTLAHVKVIIGVFSAAKTAFEIAKFVIETRNKIKKIRAK